MLRASGDHKSHDEWLTVHRAPDTDCCMAGYVFWKRQTKDRRIMTPWLKVIVTVGESSAVITGQKNRFLAILQIPIQLMYKKFGDCLVPPMATLCTFMNPQRN